MIPIEILTSEGFNKRFEENLSRLSLPQTKVYEITEREHETLTNGKRHYSSFDSFRNVRKRSLFKR